MTAVLGIPAAALFGQLLLGLINGAFYATLSLGLAVIFGLLNIINFTHGAQYMMGAFVAWMLLHYMGVGYWPALLLACMYGIMSRVTSVLELKLTRPPPRGSGATSWAKVLAPMRARCCATLE